MNKTKIEWCDYTWNPVTGCLHGCPYCYAERIAKRFTGHFKPEFHPNRLSEPMKIKKPSKIFVVSMGDLFGEWVPKEWIESVLETVEQCPQHTFIFLTKNLKRYQSCLFPDNAWVGCTVTDLRDKEIITLDALKAKVKFLSIEPLLYGPNKDIDFNGIDWIIIGAQTGPRAKKYDLFTVYNIIGQAGAQKIPVFIKDSIAEFSHIKQYPEATE